MYVNIDLVNLKIMHIHPSDEICHSLFYLEGTKVANGATYNTARRYFLSKQTSMELRILYRNTTGVDFPANFDDVALRQALINIIEDQKPQHVIQSELDAQIAAVLDELEQPIETCNQYRYVLGAKRPQLMDGGLFPYFGCEPPADAELAKAQARGTSWLYVQAPQTPEPAPAPAMRRASGPARGNARPIIWAHADAAWEAAGKPADPAKVLELRKTWMTELLEEKGIQKSTSSTALGDWMKDRLAKLAS